MSKLSVFPELNGALRVASCPVCEIPALCFDGGSAVCLECDRAASEADPGLEMRNILQQAVDVLQDALKLSCIGYELRLREENQDVAEYLALSDQQTEIKRRIEALIIALESRGPVRA